MLRIDRDPGPGQLRWFGAFWTPMMLGGVAWWAPDRPGIGWLAIGCGVLGAVSALVAVARPGWLRRPFVIGQVASYPGAWLSSVLMLGAVYLLVVTPIGLALRWHGWRGPDVGFDPSAATYWIPRAVSEDRERYFKAF